MYKVRIRFTKRKGREGSWVVQARILPLVWTTLFAHSVRHDSAAYFHAMRDYNRLMKVKEK